MKVRDLLDQLSHGELRQMALGGSEAGGIQPSDYPKVIPHIQLGLTELHKRFLLRKAEITVQQQEHLQTYHIHPRYSQTNTESTEPHKYIKDTIYMPFTDEDSVFRIERIFKEDGSEYFLNDENNVFSLYTPADLTIQVPYNDANNAMTVQCRANHPKLDLEGDDILNQDVEISSTYLEALLLYIGARYLSTSGNVESEANGLAMNAKFEASVARISNLNLSVKDNTRNEKLELNGWK